MSRKRLRFPEDVRESLTRRFSNQHQNWMNQHGEWPLVMALGSPTENDVEEDVGGIRAWVNAWSDWRDIGEIAWEDRQWPRLGRQRIPTTFKLASPEQVATVVNQQVRWTLARERQGRLITQWPKLAEDTVLSRHFDVLADYSDTNFERLWSLMLWLERNPRSGMYLRQLPVEGLDTKWIERRKGLVTELVCAIRGEFQERDFFAACGLRGPRHRIRIRLLCPSLRDAIAGLQDFEAPLEEIVALPLAPAAVIIVENLETGLALPDIPGVVALMKLGLAVGVLDVVPWLQGIPVVYWGDIDTHGYAILAHARRALPSLTSILMDKETLFNYRKLWVEEPMQNVSVELSLLKDHERMVCEGLRRQDWGRNIRLEQERIPWSCALETVKGQFPRSLR
jgi:hypothetical protein